MNELPAGTGGEAPTVLGKELLVPINCPHCGAKGRAAWDHLDRGFRCPHCKRWFQITCDGPSQWQAAAHAFHCPRCGERGTLAVASDKTACPSCTLSLYLGPDGRLYSAEKLAELQERLRIAAAAARQMERLESKRRGSRWAARATIVASVAVLLAWGGALLLARAGNSPGHRSAQLAKECLAGEWDAAARFVGEDELQLAEFAKWRIVHFASIQDRVRPAGDWARIAVEIKQETAEQMIVEATISSKLIGRRRHVQYWNRENDQWLFDATSSLHDPQRALGNKR